MEAIVENSLRRLKEGEDEATRVCVRVIGVVGLDMNG